MFDALDEHDDGQVVRDEFLASLDLDHPHLMALLKATALATTTTTTGAGAGAGAAVEGAVGTGAETDHLRRDHRHSASTAKSRKSRNRRGIAGTTAEAFDPDTTLSAFDAIEANVSDFISWGEVSTHTCSDGDATHICRQGPVPCLVFWSRFGRGGRVHKDRCGGGTVGWGWG